MQRIDCIQGENDWYEHRRGIPTASEFGRFITAARGDYSKQAVGYIADLIVESVEGCGETFRNEWMQRGIEMEGEARSFYEFDNEVDVEQTGIILNKGAGWSPDGLIGPGALEIKCPKASTHVKWLLAGTLPGEYTPQVHGALIIGELDWIDFLSYVPGYRPLIIRVVPNDYTKKVGAALTKFLDELQRSKSAIIDQGVTT